MKGSGKDGNWASGWINITNRFFPGPNHTNTILEISKLSHDFDRPKPGRVLRFAGMIIYCDGNNRNIRNTTGEIITGPYLLIQNSDYWPPNAFGLAGQGVVHGYLVNQIRAVLDDGVLPTFCAGGFSVNVTDVDLEIVYHSAFLNMYRPPGAARPVDPLNCTSNNDIPMNDGEQWFLNVAVWKWIKYGRGTRHNIAWDNLFGNIAQQRHPALSARWTNQQLQLADNAGPPGGPFAPPGLNRILNPLLQFPNQLVDADDQRQVPIPGAVVAIPPPRVPVIPPTRRVRATGPLPPRPFNYSRGNWPPLPPPPGPPPPGPPGPPGPPPPGPPPPGPPGPPPPPGPGPGPNASDIAIERRLTPLLLAYNLFDQFGNMRNVSQEESDEINDLIEAICVESEHSTSNKGARLFLLNYQLERHYQNAGTISDEDEEAQQLIRRILRVIYAGPAGPPPGPATASDIEIERLTPLLLAYNLFDQFGNIREVSDEESAQINDLIQAICVQSEHSTSNKGARLFLLNYQVHRHLQNGGRHTDDEGQRLIIRILRVIYERPRAGPPPPGPGPNASDIEIDRLTPLLLALDLFNRRDFTPTETAEMNDLITRICQASHNSTTIRGRQIASLSNQLQRHLVRNTPPTPYSNQEGERIMESIVRVIYQRMTGGSKKTRKR
jgi:hypothetical protein